MRTAPAIPGPPLPAQSASRVATITVIVPSWRRPVDLARCLRALAAQSLAPFEVIVGARSGDAETLETVAAAAGKSAFPVKAAVTAEAGVIAAMNIALDSARGDVIALTDDDAEPRPDWLERIHTTFADRTVGAVGGRDWQPKERSDRDEVGRVQWFGRVIGNHHLGAGPSREVDILKGVNLAVRAPLLKGLGFDKRLRGAGAQMFWEMGLCLPIRRAGWKLTYDPAIAVDHHIAPRHDDDQRHRGVFVAEPQVDAVHNETLLLLEHLDDAPVPRAAFALWAFLVGTRMEPGLAQLPRLVFGGAPSPFAQVRATIAGRIAGWRSWQAYRRA
jgi:glycosyltransferase involved in cell wall biosynthesis